MDVDGTDEIDTESLFEDNHNGTCGYNYWQRKLNRYCAEGRADENTNVLEWCKRHQITYVNLVRMARDYLSVSATSVTAERLFSRSSLTIKKHRNRLSDESIRFLIKPNSCSSCSPTSKIDQEM